MKKVAVWKCAECGNAVEARCKPGKCAACGAPKAKLAKEVAAVPAKKTGRSAGGKK